MADEERYMDVLERVLKGVIAGSLPHQGRSGMTSSASRNALKYVRVSLLAERPVRRGFRKADDATHREERRPQKSPMYQAHRAV